MAGYCSILLNQSSIATCRAGVIALYHPYSLPQPTADHLYNYLLINLKSCQFLHRWEKPSGCVSLSTLIIIWRKASTIPFEFFQSVICSNTCSVADLSGFFIMIKLNKNFFKKLTVSLFDQSINV